MRTTGGRRAQGRIEWVSVTVGSGVARGRAKSRVAVFPVAWPLAAVSSALAAVFVPLALLRSIDGDEGSYLLAAKLVGEGELPYRDFVYPQMPLLPYVYAGWSALTTEGWYAARLLSALLAVGLGVSLYAYAARRFGPRLALLGTALYASSSLVFGWLTVVKTYALSTLLLFAAYALVTRERPGRLAWAAAGIALGLAIDTRLLFAAAVPAFAWAGWHAGRRAAAMLAAGLLAGLVPALVFLAADPDRFLWDNLEAQGTRSSSGLVGDVPQKARVAANLLGFGDTDGVVGPQFLLLAIAAGAATFAVLLLRRRLPLSLAIAFLLGGASLLPTPTYPQYFCVTVPFLAVSLLELLERVRPGDRELRIALTGLLACGVGAYVLLAAIDVHRYARGSRPLDARIATVERVASVVQANTRTGERVLASWPGYLFGTHARPYPGLENDFSPRNASTISPEEAHRYRLATIADVERAIRARRTRLVVFRLWQTLPPQPDWQGALRAGRYRLLERVGTASVYVRSGA